VRVHADPKALADRLVALAASRPRVLAGIAGAPGAGKSALAAIDTFDGAGYTVLLKRIAAGGDTVWAPAFDRGIEQPIAGSIPVPSHARILITEGNYLQMPFEPWARIRPLLDAAWYLDIDDAKRYSRLVERHVRFGRSRAAAEAWGTGCRRAECRTHRADRRVRRPRAPAGMRRPPRIGG
jgi:pantothenate kinase